MFDYTKEHVEMTKKGFDKAPIANIIATPGHILALVGAIVLDVMLVPGVLEKEEDMFKNFDLPGLK